MPKFRSKPVEIEAEQWDGWTNTQKGICRCNPTPHVHTMHDNQIVNLEKGDWIVPEPNGVNFYPIKDEVFRNKYEEIMQKENPVPAPEPVPQEIDKAENDAIIANERAKDEIEKLDQKGEPEEK